LDPQIEGQSDDQMEELIVGYVLGTLSRDERQSVDRLLEGSEHARALLREYQDSLGGFALTAPKRTAPPALAAAFRERLAREASVASAPASGSGSATRPMAARRPPALETRRPARVLTTWQIGAAIAAAVVIVFVAVFVLTRPSTDTQTRIAQIVAAAEARRFDLAPQTSPGDGTLRLVALPGNNDAVLEAMLPAAPSGQQYQLWFIQPNASSGSGISSGGVFDASPNQTSRVLVSIPDPKQAYTLGVTLEPTGGSAQPTMNPLYIGQLPPLS
jgi:anti-sigma-K factor RskA